MTIHQAYTDLTQRLSSVYDNREAAQIADWTLESITGLKKIDRVLHRAKKLDPGQEATLQQYTADLLRHRPVQYVLGESWFAGRKFKVNEHVLIPRPETEELVDWITGDMNQLSKAPVSVLDIGTGSGCIAVSIKIKCTNAQVSAIDVSQEALAVAKGNALQQNVTIDFIQCDILNKEARAKLPKVDIIVSNPPYIPGKDKRTMHPNVLEFEPHVALFVEDNDALIFYREIADFATDRLSNGGAVYFEIHEELGEEVVSLLKKKGFQNITLRQDLQGKNRMVKAV